MVSVPCSAQFARLRAKFEQGSVQKATSTAATPAVALPRKLAGVRMTPEKLMAVTAQTSARVGSVLKSVFKNNPDAIEGFLVNLERTVGGDPRSKSASPIATPVTPPPDSIQPAPLAMTSTIDVQGVPGMLPPPPPPPPPPPSPSMPSSGKTLVSGVPKQWAKVEGESAKVLQEMSDAHSKQNRKVNVATRPKCQRNMMDELQRRLAGRGVVE